MSNYICELGCKKKNVHTYTLRSQAPKPLNSHKKPCHKNSSDQVLKVETSAPQLA